MKVSAQEATPFSQTWPRFWRATCLAAGALSAVTAAVLFVLSAGRPYVGAFIRPQVDGSWIVADTIFGGLASNAGIKAGDRVLAVNGMTADALSQREHRLADGAIREIVVLDSAGAKRTATDLGARTSAKGLYTLAGAFVVGATYWVAGTFVYWKRPDGKGVLPFYWLCLVIPVGLLSTVAMTRWNGGIPLLAFEAITYALIPSLFVHFLLVFPREKRFVSRHPSSKYLCYLPSLALLCLFVLFGQNAQLYISHVRLPMLGYLVLGGFLGAGSLAHSYLHPIAPRERAQIKVFLAGVFLGVLPFALLSVTPVVLVGRPLVAPQLTIVGAVAIPLSLAYSIVRRQLLDIDFYVHRTIVYGVVVGCVVSGYIVVSLMLTLAFGALDQTLRLAILIVFSCVMVVLFQSLTSGARLLVDDWLFRGQRDRRQALAMVIDALPSFKGIEPLGRFIVESVSQIMELRGSSLVLVGPPQQPAIEYSAGVFSQPPQDAPSVELARRLLETNGNLVPAPPNATAVLLARLSAQGRDLGVLLLGSKESGTVFNAEELATLRTFARQAAHALENALLVEQMHAQRTELQAAYEQLNKNASSLEESKRDLEAAYLGMAQALAAVVEAGDPYLRGHSERVALLAQRIGPALGLSSREVRFLAIAARLHDLWKVHVPEGTWLQPGAPDGNARTGAAPAISRSVDLLRYLPFLGSVLPAIERHREWYAGGSGPMAAGSPLPLEARILAVACAYDRMTSPSPPEEPLSHERAVELLKGGAGTAWDPVVVDALLRSMQAGQTDPSPCVDET